MNLLKEIAPYREQIENNSKGHGFSNDKDLNKVAKIWHAWLIQSDENIYPNNAGQKITDMSCNSCKKKLLQLSWAWINILEGREENKPEVYKAIKEAAPIEDIVDEANEALKVSKEDAEAFTEIVEEMHKDAIRLADHPEMTEADKIAHLRQALKELDVKYHHKMRSKSLQKLLDKHSK